MLVYLQRDQACPKAAVKYRSLSVRPLSVCEKLLFCLTFWYLLMMWSLKYTCAAIKTWCTSSCVCSSVLSISWSSRVAVLAQRVEVCGFGSHIYTPVLCLRLADDPGVSLSVVTDHYTQQTATLIPHHQKLYPVNAVMSSKPLEYFKLLIFWRLCMLIELEKTLFINFTFLTQIILFLLTVIFSSLLMNTRESILY